MFVVKRFFSLLERQLCLFKRDDKTGERWNISVVRERMYLTIEVPVVTICTARRSLYVPHSGHFMYRTVVTICTAQWPLSVPHSGHYMYRTAVTICTAQWSLYLPPV
jgi:hypothetical protein